MMRINRKVWSIIEKNNLNNVQVITIINTFISSVTVVFSSCKDYKIFVRQFEHKYGIMGAKVFPERMKIIWEN